MFGNTPSVGGAAMGGMGAGIGGVGGIGGKPPVLAK